MVVARRYAVRTRTAVIGFVLVSCASTATTDAPAGTAAPKATSTPSSTGPATTLATGEASLKACIEAAGYDFEEVYPPPRDPVPPEGSVWNDPAFFEAHSRCIVEAGLAEPSPRNDPASVAAKNREALELTQCMRDRGWDYPEPQADDPALPGRLVWKGPVVTWPDDPEAADQWFRDHAECGDPLYDTCGKILLQAPREDDERVVCDDPHVP